ncbi:hypothetical protein ACXYL9_12975 [Qipengyuania sp. CAU 1752]
MQKRQASPRDFAPELPRPCLVVGVTGHRGSHPAFPDVPRELDAAFQEIFAQIDTIVAGIAGRSAEGEASKACTTRLVTLLADGTDQMAAQQALDRGWDLTAPLPFGRALNTAINAHASSVEDARALLSGGTPSDAGTGTRAAALDALVDRACLFELADQDEVIIPLLLDSLGNTDNHSVHEMLQIATSRRAAIAGSLLVEHSDLVIAVWDGRSVDSVGGTGHTVSAALELGVPVLWIDPTRPHQWRLYHTAEELAARTHETSEQACTALADHIKSALELDKPVTEGRFAGIAAIAPETWRDTSIVSGHVYRRIETFFGRERWSDRLASLHQRYETPDEIGAGSGQTLLQSIAALPGQDPQLATRLEREILRRFAWTDAISSGLADRYRSGMVLNFLLGAAAIIVGVLYLPLVDVSRKWIFAAIELGLLVLIIYNTVHGQRRRLHGRWFESRRAAEYLRHSPYLLALGVARAAGRWPRGVKNWWPEWYVRHAIGAVGLPRLRIDTAYLHAVLQMLRDHHVLPQRSYHHGKAARLEKVHHRLDKMSEYSFAAAVLFVAFYLVLAGMETAGLIDGSLLGKTAKWFTVAAVALPTIGGAIAAIRYFADFERFAEISEVTANELDQIANRIEAMLAASPERLDFSQVARIVHDTDDIVFSEIQNWQAVFSGKRTTIPA